MVHTLHTGFLTRSCQGALRWFWSRAAARPGTQRVLGWGVFVPSACPGQAWPVAHTGTFLFVQPARCPASARFLGRGQPPWVRAGPGANGSLAFSFYSSPFPSLPHPFPPGFLAALALPLPCEIVATVPAPAAKTQRPLAFRSSPGGRAVIQLWRGGFLLFFLPLFLSLLFFFSFLF